MKLKPVSLKSVAIIIMVVTMLFSSIGFVLTYHVQKFYWYKQQLEAKDGERVVTLELSLADYKNALVDDNELLIDGEWYDVREVNKVGIGIKVRAVHDEHEKSLLGFLDALTENDEEKSYPLQHWLKVLQTAALTTNALEIHHVIYHSVYRYSVLSSNKREHMMVIFRPPCLRIA